MRPALSPVSLASVCWTLRWAGGAALLLHRPHPAAQCTCPAFRLCEWTAAEGWPFAGAFTPTNVLFTAAAQGSGTSTGCAGGEGMGFGEEQLVGIRLNGSRAAEVLVRCKSEWFVQIQVHRSPGAPMPLYQQRARCQGVELHNVPFLGLGGMGQQ